MTLSLIAERPGSTEDLHFGRENVYCILSQMYRVALVRNLMCIVHFVNTDCNYINS